MPGLGILSNFVDPEQINRDQLRQRQTDAMSLVSNIGYTNPADRAGAQIGGLLGAATAKPIGLSNEQQQVLRIQMDTQKAFSEWRAANPGAPDDQSELQFKSLLANNAIKHGRADLGSQILGDTFDERQARAKQQLELDKLGLGNKAGKLALDDATAGTAIPIWKVGETNADKSMQARIDPISKNAIMDNGEVIPLGKYTSYAPRSQAYQFGPRAGGAGSGPSFENMEDPALDMAARSWLTDRKMPFGAWKNGDAVMIFRKASQIAAANGDSNAAAVANSYAFQAQQQGIRRTVSAFDVGRQGDQVRSMNVIIQHLNQLDKMGAALENTKLPAFNYLMQAWSRQTGKPAPTSFEAVRDFVALELDKALIANGGSQQDRAEAKARFALANSPTQLLDVARQQRALLGGQMIGLKQQYEAGTMRNDFNRFLAPETIAEIGAGDTTPQPAPTPSSMGVAPPGAAPAAVAPGSAKFKNPTTGQTYTLPPDQFAAAEAHGLVRM